LTGPAEGKLPLECRVILYRDGEREVLEGAQVYIHLKGYALARVTHLDVEHEALNRIYPPRGGSFQAIVGVDGGLEIRLPRGRIIVLNPLLNRVLAPGQVTRTWVGGKFGGIYVGFRKAEIGKLEELAGSLKTRLTGFMQGGEG